MKNDDGIAPVIAAMLILAVVVTLFSIYNATYLPGLKQSAEIQHLHEVEEGVLKFGSAIEEAASLRRNISLSQQIPLGGGDIVLNSLKSGGSLHVQKENEPYLWINNTDTGLPISNFSMVNVSYWTVDNFWVDQGYIWQYGYVNVSRTSGNDEGTPLQYATMNDVNEKILESSFGGTLIDVEPSMDGSNYTVGIVNFLVGNDSFSSGNGIGRLELKTFITESVFPNNLNVSFNVTSNTAFYNCLKSWDGERRENVTLKLINITISAY